MNPVEMSYWKIQLDLSKKFFFLNINLFILIGGLNKKFLNNTY